MRGIAQQNCQDKVQRSWCRTPPKSRALKVRLVHQIQPKHNDQNNQGQREPLEVGQVMQGMQQQALGHGQQAVNPLSASLVEVSSVLSYSTQRNHGFALNEIE